MTLPRAAVNFAGRALHAARHAIGYTPDMLAARHDIARKCSPFLDALIQRHPDWFEELQGSGRLDKPTPPQAETLDALIDATGLDPGLRAFRNREMLRITWREMNRLATFEETMLDLSRLAELCLQAACSHHHRLLRERFGSPTSPEGAPQELCVLALGKLGGHELNLSSDIDLVFAFPEAGETGGAPRLSNEQYFIRLARQVIRSLSEMTEQGFCFRVDTRLRPFGASGPLVCSFGAMEQYYQREGRDWERYALVKARPVAGDLQAGAELVARLAPFVYRRYIDFGAVEALHAMRDAVRTDARRQDRASDIKRGPGGIREIEFLVQAFQLMRGGREPSLRTPSLLLALAALEGLSVCGGWKTPSRPCMTSRNIACRKVRICNAWCWPWVVKARRLCAAPCSGCASASPGRSVPVFPSVPCRTLTRKRPRCGPPRAARTARPKPCWNRPCVNVWRPCSVRRSAAARRSAWTVSCPRCCSG
jgi:glutamine synthetase adenylyltransferase